MTRSLGAGDPKRQDHAFDIVPGSLAHLREPIQSLDTGATVYVDHDLYVPYVNAQGEDVMVLLWVKGEYITPIEALRIHYNEPTRMQLLEAEHEEMKRNAQQGREQEHGAQGGEQGPERG